MKFVSWRVSALPVVCALALQACGGGGGGSSEPAAKPATKTTETTVDVRIASGGVVTLSGSPAQVSLPANGMVNAATLQPVTGNVTVTLATIDPSADPHDMPGGRYEALANPVTGQIVPIESFGAITVTLDQAGNKLQLAKGQTATIRIPVQSRSAERPTSIPLYYWDEARNVWVQEGTATLKGDASGAYYEGQVSHFSTWNADKPIEESVEIQGCVEISKGVPAAAGSYVVYTEGMDYSGLAWGTNNGSDFSVLAKKNGNIDLHLVYKGNDQVVRSAKADVSGKLGECFVVSTSISAVSNFLDLLESINNSEQFAFESIQAVDTDFAQMLNPATLCQSGSASGVTLNQKPVSGGELLAAGSPYTLSTTFKACKVQPDVGQPAGDVTTVITGQSTASFTYNLNNNGVSASMVSTLVNFQDTGLMLGSTGSYALAYSEAANASGTTVTPSAGTTLSHLGTVNTLTFKGGSFSQVANLDGAGNAASFTSSYNKLSYTFNGATYVLDGSMTNSKGLITLTKNGSVAATLTLTSGGFTATGTVDPF